MIEAGEVSLVLPKQAVEEFARNKDRRGGQGRRARRDARRAGSIHGLCAPICSNRRTRAS
jgi:hypothetical protein